MGVEDDQLGDNSQSPLLSSVLSLGNEIEQLTVKCLSSPILNQGDKVGVLILSMSVRCLNFFRSILYLSREQLTQPVATCLRSLIEQRWVFEAVANEETREEAIRRLDEHNEYDRKRSLGNLRALGQVERDHRITDESLAKLETSLDSSGDYHSLKSWAELAKRNPEYLTAYALLCGQTHPSLRAVENHLLFDANGQINSVTAKVEIQSLPLHALQACEVMIDLIAACPVAWRTVDIASQATNFRHRLGELWERVYDPLSQK